MPEVPIRPASVDPRRVAQRAAQSVVVRGAVVAEELRVTEVPGFPKWIETGIYAEQFGRRLLRSGHGPRATIWGEGGRSHEGDRGIVLINGWTLSGRVWPRALLDDLEAKHRVVRVDNRGTGDRRGVAGPFTVADLADDVERVIDAADLDRPIVVGFSLGGMIAIELAVRHPASVGGLVVMSSRPPNPAQTVGTRSVASAFQAPDPVRPFHDQLIERWGAVAAPGFAEAHPERLHEMAGSALSARTPWRTVLAQARAVMAWRQPRRISEITLPMLVVHGTEDDLSPVANARRIAEAIPGTELVEVEGVGHLLPQERPDLVADLVLRHAAHAAR